MPALPNPKWEKFAQLVANGASQAEAYKTAVSAGIKRVSIDQSASRLMADEKVASRIEELQEIAARHIDKAYAEITVDRIAEEWRRIAFLDPRRIVSEEGGLINPKDLPEDVAAAISSIEWTDKGGLKLRFWDKNVALTGLAKWRRMLVEQHEHGRPGEFGLPRQPDEARELLDRIRAEKALAKGAAPVALPGKERA